MLQYLVTHYPQVRHLSAKSYFLIYVGGWDIKCPRLSGGHHFRLLSDFRSSVCEFVSICRGYFRDNN